jgi:hypothetical protein
MESINESGTAERRCNQMNIYTCTIVTMMLEKMHVTENGKDLVGSTTSPSVFLGSMSYFLTM